ncbi:prenyltransferase/squalene oxidase repeat-containing protein [Mucilaginibacter sp.]
MPGEPAADQSLLPALESFFDSLSTPLVSPMQLGLLKNAAAFFPPILRLGLECRLNGREQVDLQLCFRRDEDDLNFIFHWFERQFGGTGEEEVLLRNFFEKWANPLSSYHQDIVEVFLELDVLPSGNHIPLLFLALDISLSAAERKAFCNTLLSEVLGYNKSFFPTLNTVIDACPPGAAVAYVGILCSRNIDILRVNIKKLAAAEVVPFLEAIGYQWLNSQLKDCIDFVYSYADRVTLCIDLGQSVYPGIGFECFWNAQPPKETYWQHFITELINRGLCEPAKAEAILNWDEDIFPDKESRWPEHLWLESLYAPEHEFIYLKKKISHLKLSYHPGKQAEVKAYLGYGNLRMDLSIKEAKVPKPLTNVPVAINQLDNAISHGIEFLLQAQTQTGWWKDFHLPAGRSDEWVTAYIAYHISQISDSRLTQPLATAWDALQRRFKPDSGWAYNALVPADADSTAWACLFADSIGINNIVTQEGHTLLNRYFTAEGGVATYAGDEPIRKLTQLSEEASFSGWQGAHLCVTAACALTGHKQALNYLLQHQSSWGYWESYWWTADEYATALATEALLKENAYEHSGPAFKATKWATTELAKLLQVQGKSFQIALLLKILLATNNNRQYQADIEQAVKYLLNTQQASGNWAASAELRVPMPGNAATAGGADTWLVKDLQTNFTTATVLYVLNKYCCMLK